MSCGNKTESILKRGKAGIHYMYIGEIVHVWKK